MLKEIRQRWEAWMRRLDLDDTKMSANDLEVFAPESGRRTPRRMAVLFVQCVLGQVLADDCVAVNIFYDEEDDCVRSLEYFGWRKLQEPADRELLPAPGCFAEQVLQELRWRVGVDCPGGSGTLHFKYEGIRRTAFCEVPDLSEVCVYFTDDRPTMRNKRTKGGRGSL